VSSRTDLRRRGRPYCHTTRELIAQGMDAQAAMREAHRQRNAGIVRTYPAASLSAGCAARRRRYKREWMRRRRAQLHRERQLSLPWLDRDRFQA
jgi:hypothetical protein